MEQVLRLQLLLRMGRHGDDLVHRDEAVSGADGINVILLLDLDEGDETPVTSADAMGSASSPSPYISTMDTRSGYCGSGRVHGVGARHLE